MTTQTAPVTIDVTPIWNALIDLSWYAPSDLSEIDENWCYNMALDYCAGELEELAEQVPWTEWYSMAHDLRDILHDARAEDAQFLSGRW